MGGGLAHSHPWGLSPLLHPRVTGQPGANGAGSFVPCAVRGGPHGGQGCRDGEALVPAGAPAPSPPRQVLPMWAACPSQTAEVPVPTGQAPQWKQCPPALGWRCDLGPGCSGPTELIWRSEHISGITPAKPRGPGGRQGPFPRDSPPPAEAHRYIMNVFHHFDNRLVSPFLYCPLIAEMKL